MTQAPDVLYESRLMSLPLRHRGKVRDIYVVDEEHLLIVTTDRLSAFDVVLPTPIPGKGRILTELSRFWFERTRDLVPNHLADLPLRDVLPDSEEHDRVVGRAMVVRRLNALPIEAIVRGYIAGSGWQDYQRTGSVCGIPLPAGLRLADKLPEPIFTPSTKAAVGDHDENIPLDRMRDEIGAELTDRIRDITLTLYRQAEAYAAERGILIADTKLEFGLDDDGEPVLIDEVLTPDSSRFWPADQYRPGMSPPSFDKQYVRDYLETLDWNKTAPGPALPETVVRQTRAKYEEALRRLKSSE